MNKVMDTANEVKTDTLVISEGIAAFLLIRAFGNL